MSILQFNLAADKFCAVIREELKKLPFCPTQELTVREKPSLLSHVRFDAGAEMRRMDALFAINVPTSSGTMEAAQVSGARVQVLQPVALYITSLAALEASGDAPATPEYSPQVTIVLDVGVELLPASKPALKLCVSFSDVDPGFLGGFVDASQIADLRSRLGGLLPPSCKEISLEGLVPLLGAYPDVVNAGITLDPDARTLCIRLQTRDEAFSAPDTLASWQRFHAGEVAHDLGAGADDLAKEEWSLFVGRELVQRSAAGQVRTAFAEAPGGAVMVSGPDASWSPHAPGVTVKLGVVVVDACTCFWGEADLNVDVTVAIAFSVPEPDLLEMRVNLSYDPDNWESVCCAITGALLWPFIGVILMGKQKIDWQMFLGGLAAGPLAVFIGMLAAIGKTPDFPLDSTWEKVSETEGFYRSSVSLLDAGGLGRLSLRGAAGVGSGLLLSGTWQVSVLREPVLGIGDSTPFEWGWSYKTVCGNDPVPVARATVAMSDSGPLPRWLPLSVCDVSVRDHRDVTVVGDRYGQFGPFLKWSPGVDQVTGSPYASDLVLEIAETDFKPEYLAEPYPAKVLVRSNGGARLLTLPPVPPLTPEVREELMRGLSGARKIWCRHIPVIPFSDVPLVSFPTSDPPGWWERLDWERVSDVWQVIVHGLRPGDAVALRDRLGEVIGTARASDRGVARLSAFAAPAGREVRLAHVPASGSRARPQPVSDSGARLVLQRTLLVEEAVLALNGPCTRLEAGRFRGAPALFAVTPAGLSVFEVALPAFPALVHRWTLPGLLGATAYDGSFLAWGEPGLARTALPGTRDTAPGSGVPVLDVATSGGLVYALTERSVDVYDGRLQRVGGVPLRDGRHLAVAGGTLAVADTGGLHLFDLARRRAPAPAGSFREEHVSGLRRAENFGRADTLFVQGDGSGGRVLDVSREGRKAAQHGYLASLGAIPDHAIRSSLPEVARFEQAPWFAGAARVGRVLARLDTARTSLRVYVAVPLPASGM